MSNNMPPYDWTLSRLPQGTLQLRTADGALHDGVTPVRAFPLNAPDEGLALVGTDGQELAWIARLDETDAATRQLIEEELSPREFRPLIQRILDVSAYATPSTWRLETDRGPAQLVLKSEDDIRRLAGGRLLILDASGLQFEIADRFTIDRGSRRILNRFL